MGIIYICESSNVGGGILKVGVATDEKLMNERFRKHEVDGYRNISFKPYFAVSTPKYEEIEELMKTLFSKSRIVGTELYVLEKEVLRELFGLFGTQIYPKKQHSDETPIKKPLDETVEEKKRKIAKKVKRSDLGIKYGDHLVFTSDESIIVENIDDDVVRYDGNDYSITAIARILLNNMGYMGRNLNGNDYFRFKGCKLSDIAKDKKLR